VPRTVRRWHYLSLVARGGDTLKSDVLRFGLIFICWTCLAAPPAAELARSIRETGLDPAECYRVRDFSFQKEDIKVYLTDGYLIFSKPVEGERRAAVFSADVEGGDGEVILLPPYRGERQSLALFTQSANLDEHFDAALMIFTDGTRSLAERLHEQGASAPSVKKADEMGVALAGKWDAVLKSVESGLAMRMVVDLAGPAGQSGMAFLAFSGRQVGNFDVIYDPRSREQIEAGQMVERNGRSIYNLWTSFQSRSARLGATKPPEPWFSTSDYRIDATLDTDLAMKVATRVKVRVGSRALRGFPFEISNAMRVTAVKIDGVPAEVFADENELSHVQHIGDNDVFLVSSPAPLEAASVHEFEFEHQGAVIAPAGNGVFFVASRASWYPRYGDSFATYDVTFHYPRRWTLVAAGDQLSDATEAETRVTEWRTPVPIRMAGFNLGDYEKVTGNVPGFKVEVYGNKSVEAALLPKVRTPDLIQPFPPAPKQRPPGIDPSAQAQIAPDPRARLHDVAADVTSSLEFFNSKFGPPALRTLTVAPIPGAFGQGFPGLVYLSTLSYLDPSQRPANMRGEQHQLFFSELITAHEVAHQWWGNVVTASAYQDEWISEALANYSALLWLERKKGARAVDTVLESFRDDLMVRNAEARTAESAGPIVWGTRLGAAGIDGAWRVITYEKGAWIVHMLRRRLGDERFFDMLAEMRRRYEFRSISTEDFRALAKEFVPPRTPPDAIDNFFDNWVFSTGIPSLRIKYSVKGTRISGSVEQSGVSDDFSVDVPVEIHFAKGAPQTVWVRTSNDGATFSATLRQPPLRAAIGTAVLMKK